MLCLTGVTLAGCGAGGPTKAQIVARADAICSSALATLRSQQASGAQIAAVVPVIRREVTALRALGTPSQDRGLWKRYIAAMRTELADWVRLAAAQETNSAQPTLQATTALNSSPAPALASRYGLRDCQVAGATVGSGATSGLSATSTVPSAAG